MSTQKTEFDKPAAEAFIEEHFDQPATELTVVADGETSQAFLFDAPEGPRVLRVSKLEKTGFLKDQLAYRFNSDLVPVPEIFEVGDVADGLSFAMSERAPGRTLDKMTKEELDTIMPDIIATVDAIHAIEPLGEGYGDWNLNGVGKSKTWRDHLRNNSLGEDDEETRGAEFYDAELHQRLRAEINPLIDAMPEERKMIHDDFGFDNTLSDGVRITGVIDWEHAGYGDPIKDIAWLDFWGEKQGFADSFRKHYGEQGILPTDFDQRLTCYKLLIGVGSLGFFARSRQKDSYKTTIGIIDRIKR